MRTHCLSIIIIHLPRHTGEAGRGRATVLILEHFGS
jgi:hypothetical protein